MLNDIKRYNKSIYIGLDARSDGIMGELLTDEWNASRDSIDKNHDGVMQYVLLEGERNNLVAADRTKYSILALSEARVKTQELERVFAYWSREPAKEVIESLFLKIGPNIEVIIANDDSMALGAIESLQSYGYNLGDKEKNIAVVGVEGLPESQKLIREGLMLGTIFQDPKALEEVLYITRMNMVQGRDPIEGTDYQFNGTGVAIRILN
nr:substrate-binding domain-containing protein [Clostridium beijerinckii]